jgi:hypothetical protein
MLPFNRSRLAVIATGALVVLPTALAQATSVATPKTTGVYQTAATGRFVRFVVSKVTKTGTQKRMLNLLVECAVSGKASGYYYLGKGPLISSRGTFSYSGSVSVYKARSAHVGTAKLVLSGRFTSSTAATGTAVISHSSPRPSGCPGSSFTARYSAASSV